MASRSSCGDTPLRTQSGFTYLGVLIAIALLGIGLSVVSEVWSKTAERQKRIQLEWVGQQYVQAIQSYYYANTGNVQVYPPTLDALLEDTRYLSTRRHIRVLYPDPFSGKVQWRLISAPGGGIQGVALEGGPVDSSAPKQFIFVPTPHDP